MIVNGYAIEPCANLRGADLRGAILEDATGLHNRVIVGPTRRDGYRFLLTRTEPGPWRIKAGCRNFTLPEAREHWERTRGGTPLGYETQRILAYLMGEAVARK